MSLQRLAKVQLEPTRTVTYIPACQLPKPRMDSAWTLVMRNKFSVSAKFVES
jgi:hypothetical protein